MLLCDCPLHKTDAPLPEGFNRLHRHHRNCVKIFARSHNGIMMDVIKYIGDLGYKNQYPGHASIFICTDDVDKVDENNCVEFSYYFSVRDQKERVIDDDTNKCSVHRKILIPRDLLEDIVELAKPLVPRYQDCPITFMNNLNRLIELLTAKEDYANALKICGLEFADLY